MALARRGVVSETVSKVVSISYLDLAYDELDDVGGLVPPCPGGGFVGGVGEPGEGGGEGFKGVLRSWSGGGRVDARDGLWNGDLWDGSRSDGLIR